MEYPSSIRPNWAPWAPIYGFRLSSAGILACYASHHAILPSPTRWLSAAKAHKGIVYGAQGSTPGRSSTCGGFKGIHTDSSPNFLLTAPGTPVLYRCSAYGSAGYRPPGIPVLVGSDTFGRVQSGIPTQRPGPETRNTVILGCSTSKSELSETIHWPQLTPTPGSYAVQGLEHSYTR